MEDALHLLLVREVDIVEDAAAEEGKTMLAQAVSQALGKELIIWNVKSTTKAQDGLYVYPHIDWFPKKSRS